MSLFNLTDNPWQRCILIVLTVASLPTNNKDLTKPLLWTLTLMFNHFAFYFSFILPFLIQHRPFSPSIQDRAIFPFDPTQGCFTHTSNTWSFIQSTKHWTILFLLVTDIELPKLLRGRNIRAGGHRQRNGIEYDLLGSNSIYSKNLQSWLKDSLLALSIVTTNLQK